MDNTSPQTDTEGSQVSQNSGDLTFAQINLLHRNLMMKQIDTLLIQEPWIKSNKICGFGQLDKRICYNKASKRPRAAIRDYNGRHNRSNYDKGTDERIPQIYILAYFRPCWISNWFQQKYTKKRSKEGKNSSEPMVWKILRSERNPRKHATEPFWHIFIMSKAKASSSLWAYYSILKAVIKIKEDIDISNYHTVVSFLKSFLNRLATFRPKLVCSVKIRWINSFMKRPG